MRRIAWVLLLLFAFAVPWEYSLDLGEPLGNIARVIGLVLLLAAIPAVLQAGRLRTPGAMQWLVLAFYLWFCCSYFWTVEPLATLEKMRGYFQEMMIVWLVWEFAESPGDLRAMLQAFVAGSWVLALLTLANFRSAEAIAAGQIRFVAEGQDPNDVARFLDLGFPLAALLLSCLRGEQRWLGRLLALGYLPLGLMAVLLTASRGGFLAAVIALGGCGLLLMKSHPRGVVAGAMAIPMVAAGLWFAIPRETFERLATIPSQLESGDLNQRLNIWDAGWHAFARSPLLGSGAGSFTGAAGTNFRDTAHNSELSILVGGGLIALFLAVSIVALAARAALKTLGPLKLALVTVFVVWGVAAQVDTVEENRATWLLLGLIAVAGRLAVEEPEGMEECFPANAVAIAFDAHHGLSSRPEG
ncbi:MAG: O-antigen ligase family protein [Terracidiphilus sp.]|jgi:putative inorganic carbon (HCO3(-)) transporter